MGYTNRHCLRLLRRYMVEIEDLVVKRSTTQAGSLSYTRNDKRQYSFDVTKREMSTSHDTTEYHRRMFQLREGRKITSSPRTIPSFSRWSSSQCARDHPRQNKCRSKNNAFDENGEMVGPPCWNCKYAINLIKDPFFCQSCEAIQPVSPKADVFSILGVDPKFEVEISALESKFRDLQKRLHPDKFTTSSVKEQQLSVEASSAVNKAYDILRKPLRRAKCLVSQVAFVFFCIDNAILFYDSTFYNYFSSATFNPYIVTKSVFHVGVHYNP